MGTPSFVVPIFETLHSEHEILAVFTRKPKPTGRKMILTKTPAHLWAESRSLPTYTNIKDFDAAPKPDYIIVAAYGVILRDNILSAAPCINVHPSALPKYRGAAPISTAILNGDISGEICIMEMVNEVDAGAIYMREKFPIGENDTTDDIENLVSERAGQLLLKYLANPDKYPPIPQTGISTFTRKITNIDLDIDWYKTPHEIHNQVRAIGGRATINGIDCKIIKTHLSNCHCKGEACGNPVNNGEQSELIIDIIQPAGKKTMPWKDFFNGQQGKCLICPCHPAIGFDIWINTDGAVQTNS